ncbi:MAG: hypothetical protein K2J32_05025 [Ruminococcus sp.]|nr:hypothetical protein [Ruminococcus sp.]
MHLALEGHLSGGILPFLVLLLIICYVVFPISLVFLFKIVKPIGNCYIIKNFKKYERTYGKTTAVVKSSDKFSRKSVICYNVSEHEIFVTVPYYIPHETISVIYMRCKYNKVFVDCPKLQHKAIVKNLITSAILFILGVLICSITIRVF